MSQRTPEDALGQKLAVGDHVAHVYRRSSTVRITRRIVQEIDAWSRVVLVPLPNARGKSLCQGHNLVKVRAP